MSTRTGDSTARQVRVTLIQHLSARGYTAERMAPLLGMKLENLLNLANRVGLLVTREEEKS